MANNFQRTDNDLLLCVHCDSNSKKKLSFKLLY